MKKLVTLSSTIAVAAALAMLSGSHGIGAQPKPMRDILPLPPSVISAATGEEVPTESLRGKVVALYFSAHWCVPCKKFTPKLVKFYHQNKSDNFEVVFMSLDRSGKMKADYMKEENMPWLTVPGQGTKEINYVMDYHQLPGVPSLVVFGPDGQVLTTNGREDVENSPATALKKWRQSLP